MIAEYDDATSPPPGSGGTSYLTTDHLGSTRVLTGQDQSVKARHDYLPFGEALGAGLGGRTPQMGYDGPTGLRQKFTQKERDPESGLDYFGARYYSASQGRFTSPDEFTGGPDELFDFVDLASNNPTFYADVANPQSLNKYQYSYGNPLRFTDLDGHDPGEDRLSRALKGARKGAVVGAGVGAIGGAVIGGGSGAVAGGAGGTLVAPVVGTVGGGVIGGAGGAVSGAVQGAGIGAIAGAIIGAGIELIFGEDYAPKVPDTSVPPLVPPQVDAQSQPQAQPPAQPQTGTNVIGCRPLIRFEGAHESGY